MVDSKAQNLNMELHELYTKSKLDDHILSSMEKHKLILDGSLTQMEMHNAWDKVLTDVQKVENTVTMHLLKQRMDYLARQTQQLKRQDKKLDSVLQRVSKIYGLSDTGKTSDANQSGCPLGNKSSNAEGGPSEFVEPTYDSRAKQEWLKHFHEFTPEEKLMYCELRELRKELAILREKVKQLFQVIGIS